MDAEAVLQEEQKIGVFPWRDVITVRLSNHEPVIYSYPVSQDWNSLTAEKEIRSINFVQGTLPQGWKRKKGARERDDILSADTAAALIKPLLYLF